MSHHSMPQLLCSVYVYASCYSQLSELKTQHEREMDLLHSTHSDQVTERHIIISTRDIPGSLQILCLHIRTCMITHTQCKQLLDLKQKHRAEIGKDTDKIWHLIMLCYSIPYSGNFHGVHYFSVLMVGYQSTKIKPAK